MSVFSPYRALIIYHHVGTGKTAAGIAIEESLKDYLKQNDKKAIIIVPGPLFKESWYNELIKFTGHKYPEAKTKK